MSEVNDCIRCSVTTCAHHDAIAQHCKLNSIQVGCSQTKPKSPENTECASFQQRSLF